MSRNLELIEINKGSPKIINAIVEIPKGTSDPMFIKVASYFFKHYKDLNNKYVEVGEWYGKQKAYNIIKECYLRFQPAVQQLAVS